jgi:hypothetical protein
MRMRDDLLLMNVSLQSGRVSESISLQQLLGLLDDYEKKGFMRIFKTAF